MHALGSWCERYRSGTGARQSDRSSLWIKTRSALRLYFARSAPRSLHAPLRSHALLGAIIRGAKKQRFFFHPVSIFFPLLRDKTVRPIRFELRSRDQSSCGCTKGRKWWRCFQNQCEQTPKKSIPREEMSFSYHYLRTELFSHVLNIISINSPLNYVICRARARRVV